MTEDKNPRRIDVRDVRNIEPRGRGRLESLAYSSRHLMAPVAGLRKRLTGRRMLAAVLPLVVA
ncbi:MAG: hypothetical protein ACR2GX_04290, partial [Candidatus Dormibacteria bacterium]